MDKDSEIFRNLQRFANDHKLILEEDGECGFCRPCVGFLSKSGNYVDYNPCSHAGDYGLLWNYDERLCPPNTTPNAYHKHDCMAVLVYDDDYDKGLHELNEWVKSLESMGEVYIESYETGATGFQALFSGVVGHAIRIKDKCILGEEDGIHKS